jgi:predicted ABC-type ATPase
MGLTRDYLIFAGVNGAGKSTLYHSGVWRRPHFPKAMHRVNSDEILLEQGGEWSSPKDQFAAMKEAVKRIDAYFQRGISFNQETTLAGKKSLNDLRKARERGYRVIMFYVGVDDPIIAVQRIQGRIDAGGHGIAPEDVRRRYRVSLNALLKAIDLCNEVYLFDNTQKLAYACSFKNGVFVHYGHSHRDSWVMREVFDARVDFVT